MAVTYFDPGEGNFFAYKHLHVIDGPATVDQLLTTGQRVLDERRAAANLKKAKRKDHALVKTYGGSTKPPKNTLLVFAQGGFQLLNAAVEKLGATVALNKKAMLWFTVSNGAVFYADTDGAVCSATTGEVELRVGKNAKGIFVDHLEGMRNMKWMVISRNATKQLVTTGFRTTEGELQKAITQLRHVAPPGVKLPPAIVYGVPGLDLGFLDDDGP